MKRSATLAMAMFIGMSAFAQKTKVKESSETIGDGRHNAFTVTLYGVNPSDAEDSFRSFMKAYDGKRSSKDGGIFIDNAKISDLSSNTVDVYGKAQGKKGDPEITFVVAVDMGGVFLNSGDHKSEAHAMERIVRDFAIKATKDAIEEQLKEQKKVQGKLEDDQKDLEKDNKNLHEDIEKYKEKIKKAEDDIVKNNGDQQKKKGEIEAQKKVVEGVETKLKAVD
jgi:hypothetical protein